MEEDKFQIRKKKPYKWSNQEFQIKKQQYQTKMKQLFIQNASINGQQVNMTEFNKRTMTLTEQEEKAGIKLISGDFHKYYIEEGYLGQGTSAFVKKVRSTKTQQNFAAKITKTVDEEKIYNIKYEFLSMKNISNYDKIVQVYELYIDLDHGIIYAIMEYVDGVELFEKLAAFPNGFQEKFAKQIFVQILLGIKFLHDHGVCHRDLKPNNIMICKNEDNEDQIKIMDFNVSKFSSHYKSTSAFLHNQIKMRTYTGTIAYSAPEMFSEMEYTESIDMWSAGCILYSMLSGSELFQGEHLIDIIQNIKNAQVSFPPFLWDDISTNAKDLIVKLLQKDPTKRLQVEDALLHPWISKYKNSLSQTSQKNKEKKNIKYIVLCPESQRKLIKNFSSSNHFISNYIIKSQQKIISQINGNQRFQQLKENLKFQRSMQFMQSIQNIQPISVGNLDLDQKSIELIESPFNLNSVSQQQLNSSDLEQYENFQLSSQISNKSLYSNFSNLNNIKLSQNQDFNSTNNNIIIESLQNKNQTKDQRIQQTEQCKQVNNTLN